MGFKPVADRGFTRQFTNDLDLYPTTELNAVRAAVSLFSGKGRWQ